MDKLRSLITHPWDAPRDKGPGKPPADNAFFCPELSVLSDRLDDIKRGSSITIAIMGDAGIDTKAIGGKLEHAIDKLVEEKHRCSRPKPWFFFEDTLYEVRCVGCDYERLLESASYVSDHYGLIFVYDESKPRTLEYISRLLDDFITDTVEGDARRLLSVVVIGLRRMFVGDDAGAGSGTDGAEATAAVAVSKEAAERLSAKNSFIISTTASSRKLDDDGVFNAIGLLVEHVHRRAYGPQRGGVAGRAIRRLLGRETAPSESDERDEENAGTGYTSAKEESQERKVFCRTLKRLLAAKRDEPVQE